MSEKNGGPAFPQHDLSGYGMGPSEVGNGGMTLRDYFAAQAIAGGMARSSVPEYDLIAMFGRNRTCITREEIIAADAYRIANAMLLARIPGEIAK